MHNSWFCFVLLHTLVNLATSCTFYLAIFLWVVFEVHNYIFSPFTGWLK